MFLRTIVTLLSAAALTAAAQAANPCDTAGGAGCKGAAVSGAARDVAPAVAMLARALAEKQRKLGEEHPRTLVTANALAMMYKVQGRYTEAEVLYLRSLAISQRTFGDTHPFTLATMRSLASLYSTQGRLAEAALLHRRATDPTQFSY